MSKSLSLLRRRGSSAKRLARTFLDLEQLEDRCLLSFSFEPVAFLGDTLPGGPIPGGGTGQFAFDFEPGALNARGQLAFGADMSTGGEGGLLAHGNGKLSALARTRDTAAAGTTCRPFFSR